MAFFIGSVRLLAVVETVSDEIGGGGARGKGLKGVFAEAITVEFDSGSGCGCVSNAPYDVAAEEHVIKPLLVDEIFVELAKFCFDTTFKMLLLVAVDWWAAAEEEK